jgi:hypothetical protein
MMVVPLVHILLIQFSELKMFLYCLRYFLVTQNLVVIEYVDCTLQTVGWNDLCWYIVCIVGLLVWCLLTYWMGGPPNCCRCDIFAELPAINPLTAFSFQ